tara:strand:- start:4225 stop:4968 length:744 start_codon:yes stop_codon:yes gene_type:complete
MPKIDISVLMSVYNNDKTLKKSTESVLNQEFKNFEFLIIDDGSRDASWEILNKFSKKDKRIRLFKNNKRKGLAYSLNKIIKKSRGKYLARMDADDFSKKNRFKIQIEFLQKNKEIDLVGSMAKTFEGKILIVPKDDNLIKKTIIKKNPFIHPSIMARRNFFIKNRYNPKYSKCQDYELWLRVYRNHKFYNINKVLLLYNKSKIDFKTVIITFKIMTLNVCKEKNRKLKSIFYTMYNLSINLIKFILK